MNTTVLTSAPPLTELATSWATALDAEGKSPATIKAYLQGARSYVTWYATSYPDAAPLLNAAGVRAFLADLRKAGQRPGTLRLRYSALRLFGKWLASEGELDADPLVSMSPPKLDRPMVHAVADAEVTALLRACEGKAFADKRDTALVRLLVSTGMRAGEALSLTTGSVDTGHQVITVKHGKGGKDRIVPLLPETAKALAVYLRARKRHPQANQRRSETRVPADAWNRAIMTIDQLIEAATEARDELGGDAEVRLCWQPEYPIRGTLEAVTVPESDPYDEGEIAAGQENDSRMLWLAAGAVPYGENPYASSWAWEGASAW